MKFINYGTEYLSINSRSFEIDEELDTVAHITLNIIKKGLKKTFEIEWEFRFINGNKERKYSELHKTQFNYFSLGDVESDFIDLKRFLVDLVLDMQQNFINKYKILLFPEINAEILTCQVFEKIIMTEYS
jgi:hypothetical protein